MQSRSAARFHIVGVLGNNPAPIPSGKGVQVSVAIKDRQPGADGRGAALVTEWIPVIIWGEERVRIICDEWSAKDIVYLEGHIKMGTYRPAGVSKALTIPGFQVGPDGVWQLIKKGGDASDEPQPRDDGRQLPAKANRAG